jgi:hypothetical protein
MFTSKSLTKAHVIITILIMSGIQPVLAAPSHNAAARTKTFQAELHHFSLPEGTCQNGVCNYTTLHNSWVWYCEHFGH